MRTQTLTVNQILSRKGKAMIKKRKTSWRKFTIKLHQNPMSEPLVQVWDRRWWVSEPNISRITTLNIRKLTVKGISQEQSNGKRITRKDISQNTTGSLPKKDRQKFNWPICVKCGRTTSENPAKPRLTPQWWDGQWQCEDCTFKDCFEWVTFTSAPLGSAYVEI